MAAVLVIVQPVPKEKSASVWKRILIGGLVPGRRTPAQYEFRDDFYRMELWAGDELVEPIFLNRTKRILDMDEWLAYGQDIAFAGQYTYPISAFEPGCKVIIKVFPESDTTKPREVSVPDKIQQKIWDDFAPYRADTPNP